MTGILNSNFFTVMSITAEAQRSLNIVGALSTSIKACVDNLTDDEGVSCKGDYVCLMKQMSESQTSISYSTEVYLLFIFC